MSNPTIDDVRQFFESNKSFFVTPLNNQDEFRQYFEHDGSTNDIADYSKKFFDILLKTMHETGKYKAPVWELWRYGNFEKALEHKEIRQFIMDNSTHAAIISWQKEHPPTMVAKLKTVYTQEEKEILVESIEIMRKTLTSAIDQLNEFNEILLKSPSKSEVKNSNIEKIQNTINSFVKQKKELLYISWDVNNTSKEFNISDIESKIISVEIELRKTIKNNLLDVNQEKPVRSWAEKFLNLLSNFFGLGSFKSKSTKAYEESQNKVEALKENSPNLMPNAVLNAKEKFQKMKQVDSAAPESELQNKDTEPPSNTGMGF